MKRWTILRKSKAGLTESGSKEHLLTAQSPFSVREAYRSARTNLMFLPHQEENACQKFVFTSANAGEGKSTNCTNLAISLAENKKRVLLIDCDMRKPTVHRLTEQEQSPGLSEFLAGMEEALCIHKNTLLEGLDVVTSGAIPPNPAELLSSKAMRKMLSQLGKNYDYICLDTPPVNVVADALVLAEQVSGFVLVVRASAATFGDVDEALGRMQQVSAHVYGFLLNDMQYKGSHYGKYYAQKYGYGKGYGYGYGYGYGEDMQKAETSFVSAGPPRESEL